ncbi:MAG: HutD family protein [Candidatus Baltobacteraceae bacterium]
MTILPAAGYRRMLWKNGGGTTLEIAASSEDGPPIWRLSIAQIERDGPFSEFAGYDRTILPTRGNGVILSLDDAQDITLDRLGVPFSFRGESKTMSRLIDGPVTDLNMMTRREVCSHGVDTHSLTPAGISVNAADICFVYALAGDLALEREGVPITLAAGDTVRVDGTFFHLRAAKSDALACVVKIRRL